MCEQNTYNEDDRLYLQMIQNVIDRMTSCSFQAKGWCVAIAAALFALDVTQNAKLSLLGIFPALIFWWLDSFYLLCERKYRFLYEMVRKREKDFEYYDLNAKDVTRKKVYEYLKSKNDEDAKKKSWKYTRWNVIKSETIWPTYFITILLCIILSYGNVILDFLKNVF